MSKVPVLVMWLAALAVTAAFAWSWWLDSASGDGPVPAAAASAVPSPLSAGDRYVVTARWGWPSGPRSTASTADSAGWIDWSGELRLSCGAIHHADALAFESDGGDEGLDAPVRVGAGAALAFRSATRNGWDGIRAEFSPCAGAAQPATLTLHTAQRRWQAVFDASRDEFEVVGAGQQGQGIEIRLAPVATAPRGRIAGIGARSQGPAVAAESDGGDEGARSQGRERHLSGDVPGDVPAAGGPAASVPAANGPALR